MTPAQILRQAADLIERPSCWTQGHGARDSNGDEVNATDPRAVCWCAIGAIFKVAGDRDLPEACEAKSALWEVVENPGRFNDAKGRTASEVSAKLREAAALLEREPSP